MKLGVFLLSRTEIYVLLTTNIIAYYREWGELAHQQLAVRTAIMLRERCLVTVGCTILVARARTGHLVTQSYLNRFNLADSPTCTVCELVKEN